MPDDQLHDERASVELVTEQATIGARVDADAGGPGGAQASGWWAVTDAGVRLFVPETALSTASARASDGFRTLRSGQRVELHRRRDATCTVEAVHLPPQQPSPTIA